MPTQLESTPQVLPDGSTPATFNMTAPSNLKPLAEPKATSKGTPPAEPKKPGWSVQGFLSGLNPRTRNALLYSLLGIGVGGIGGALMGSRNTLRNSVLGGALGGLGGYYGKEIGRWAGATPPARKKPGANSKPKKPSSTSSNIKKQEEKTRDLVRGKNIPREQRTGW